MGRTAMKYLLQLIRYLKQLITQPVNELNRAQRFIRLCADMTRHCAQGLRHDRALQMAAALTYHTLFSLIPTLVLAMIILHSVVSDDQRQQFQNDVVELLLPTQDIPDDCKVTIDARIAISKSVDERASDSGVGNGEFKETERR